jgi:hypothetical protein
MLLSSQLRKKDGKEHTSWSVVENKRLHDGRILQRQVLYLGEINDSQRGVAQNVRRFCRGGGHAPPDRTLSLRPSRTGGRCLRGPNPLARPHPAPPPSVGRLLDGPRTLSTARPAHFFRGTPPPFPQGHRVGPHPSGPRHLSADRPRFRIASPPRMVPAHRPGRSARRRFRSRRAERSETACRQAAPKA